MINTILIILTVVTSALTVYLNLPRVPDCVIVITGESVRISGCVYSPEFIELVSKLKPAGIEDCL